jgi:hypothetical protein
LLHKKELRRQLVSGLLQILAVLIDSGYTIDWFTFRESRLVNAGNQNERCAMKVCQLIDPLREFDLDTDVYLQIESRSFAPPVWIGMLDTAGLFDEEKSFQLVVSPWEPEEYRRPESDHQRT